MSASSRPTGNTRGSAGTRSTTVGRPWGSLGGGDHARPACAAGSGRGRGRRRRARRRPRDVDVADRPAGRVGDLAVDRDPAVLDQLLAAPAGCRRRPGPAPSGACSALGRPQTAPGIARARSSRSTGVGTSPRRRRRRRPASAVGGVDGRRPCSSSSTTSAPGTNSAERRQVVERVEAEPLEELRRRAVEHGLARARVAGDLGDVAPLLERAHRRRRR